MIVHTYFGLNTLVNTAKVAEQFRLVLAVDKGYSSKLSRIPDGHRVMASDGKGVDFLRSQAQA